MRQGPNPKQQGPGGVAQMRMVGKNYHIRLKETNEEFSIEPENTELPKTFKLSPQTEYFVKISNDGNKLYSLWPANETVILRYLRPAAKEGTIPIPKHFQGMRQNKEGNWYNVDEMTFTLLAEILDPAEDAGLTVPLSFLYSTRNKNGQVSGLVDDGTGNVMVRGADKNNRLQNLISFFESAGIWDMDIPFSDNMIPTFDAFLREHGRPFSVRLRNGWADSYSPVPKVLLDAMFKTTKKTVTKAKAPSKKSTKKK